MHARIIPSAKKSFLAGSVRACRTAIDAEFRLRPKSKTHKTANVYKINVFNEELICKISLSI